MLMTVFVLAYIPIAYILKSHHKKIRCFISHFLRMTFTSISRLYRILIFRFYLFLTHQGYKLEFACRLFVRPFICKI